MVHELVHGTAINNDLNNPRDYQLIINRCRGFEGCANDEERWARLLKAYGWRSIDEAKVQLERRHIDPSVLFQPRMRPRTNQTFIADHILDLWRQKVNSEKLMNTFTSADEGFNPGLMKDLINTLLESADRLGLADVIAERIRSEVNVANVSQIKESLVADIMASTLNAFVCDFGYSMLSEQLKRKPARLSTTICCRCMSTLASRGSRASATTNSPICSRPLSTEAQHLPTRSTTTIMSGLNI